MAPALLKIAVIQLHPKPHEPESNHARAVSFIREASQAGAHLAVLPEYHLTDFFPDDPRFRDECIDWKRYLASYCSLAKECNICIAPGSVAELHHEKSSSAESFVNVSYFIDNTGAVVGRYEKKNLWHPERPYVKCSKLDPHVAFDTPVGKVGMLICWDLAFPEAFRELVNQGAKLILVPSFWKVTDCGPEGMIRNHNAEQVFLDAAIVSRACENTCAVVFCNAGGPAKDGFAGLSQVSVPFLGCIGRMETCEEGMKVIDLDMNILDEAESVYKIREDITRRDWHYSCRSTV